ncbi:MAG: hypothetical protein ABL957_04810 [Parvularculaceae bacterium]
MRLLKLALTVALMAGASLYATRGQAEITLSPLRQVLTSTAPVATYEVANPSRRTIEARVSWLDLKATETGYELAGPDDRTRRSAAPYLTVWPATFRLEPGAKTTVTVKVKNGVSIPKGERRSHLLIETEAVRTPLRKASGAMELDIDLGVSTPVLLRGGPSAAAAHFGDTRLLRTADGLLELETHLHGDAPTTAYGRIEIYMNEGGAGSRKMAALDNVAIYPEAARRRFVLPLQAVHLPAGIMEARFVGSAEFDGELFATRTFDIAPAR